MLQFLKFNQLQYDKKCKCSICDNYIILNDFRDKKSLKEYKISKICQNCQDEIFGL